MPDTKQAGARRRRWGLVGVDRNAVTVRDEGPCFYFWDGSARIPSH